VQRTTRLSSRSDRYLRGIETSVVAAPDSLLGLLQRGRGQGFINALAAGRAAAETAIVECVTHDPRIDHQVESRDEYYGRCAFALGIEISLFEALLFSPADSQETDEYRTDLVLGTLAWMGRFGRDDAVKVLRRYVAVGWNWEWAIGDMVYPVPFGLDGLDELVVKRCPDLEDLARALPWRGGSPWSDWRLRNPRIQEAFALRAEWDRQNEQRSQDLSKLSTQELLERRQVTLLRKRTASADKEVLYEALRSETDQVRRDAIKVLGWQRDPAVFDSAEAELRRSPEVDFNAGWIALFQLIKFGPIERIRSWLSESGETGVFALHMVALWPRDGDQPLLRSVLEHVNEEDWLYRVCDAVDGLAKLADREAVPDLEQVFREATYSYLRRRTARALAITSDRFPEGHGVECLWDCEEETRAIGCAVASWTSSTARQRVSQIAGDRFEARRLRALAARRERALRL
jgi:hypothetical protein